MTTNIQNNPLNTKDLFSTIEIDIHTQNLDQIQSVAAKALHLQLKPRITRAGAIYLFHTESSSFVLGSKRQNPALTLVTPKQVAGVFLKQIDPIISSKQSIKFSKPKVQDTVPSRKTMVYCTASAMVPVGAQEHNDYPEILRPFFNTIHKSEGWATTVCVSKEDDNYNLTGVIHLKCRDKDIKQLDAALQELWSVSRYYSAPDKCMFTPKFVLTPWKPILESSREDFANKETAISFHSREIACLDKVGAFKEFTPAELTFDLRSVSPHDTFKE